MILKKIIDLNVYREIKDIEYELKSLETDLRCWKSVGLDELVYQDILECKYYLEDLLQENLKELYREV